MTVVANVRDNRKLIFNLKNIQQRTKHQRPEINIQQSSQKSSKYQKHSTATIKPEHFTMLRKMEEFKNVVKSR